MSPSTGRQQAMRTIGLIMVVAGLPAWLIWQHFAPKSTDQPPIPEPVRPPSESSAAATVDPPAQDDPLETMFTQQRLQMVSRQLLGRDITDLRVLEAMRRVPRHRLVPAAERDLAYADHPLPIGHEQTISQPYIVALMTQLVQPQPNSRALDVGTGSGYQAAVLAELVEKVCSIEIVCPLADQARERLQAMGYTNIDVRCGDGYRGWPEQAPFDVIIVAAAPDHVPQPLLDQLAPGGRMVIPVGTRDQNLLLIEKQPDGSIQQSSVAPVMFVPMTGDSVRLP